jgi:serine protease Do
LGIVLGGAVVLAVTSLVAQDRIAGVGQGAAVGQVGQADRVPEDRQIMVLDGRGSRLGVMIRDLDGDEAKTASTGGVTIDRVETGSPAEKAGLRAGDIVVEYDGERVRSARQFTRLVQETPEGRQVPMALVRDGKRQTLTATPEARAFSWNMGLPDGDRILRDAGRGLRELEGFRGLRVDPPAFSFRFDDRMNGWMGLSSRGRLGVTVEPLSDQLAGYFGASDGGALVSSVEPESPGGKAGLRAGDVITSINGDRVRGPGDLADEIRQAGEGPIEIGIIRDKKPTTLKAAIEPGASGTPAKPGRRIRPAVARGA